MEAADAALVHLIRNRHAQVLEAIAGAARRADRSLDSVRLVVVTKGQPPQVARAAIDAGARILGENYAEEGLAKMREMGIDLVAAPVRDHGGDSEPDAGFRVEWHMIGHIQSRKAQLVASHFDLIHSVDSVGLARRLDRFAGELGRALPVLLEFNVGGEAAKQGWAAQDPSVWPKFLDEVSMIAELPHLKVQGLMTMPPLSNDPENARIYFRRLRKLQNFLGAKVSNVAWSELSMGTSADYAVAVEEGATLVRVGEAILGARPRQEPA